MKNLTEYEAADQLPVRQWEPSVVQIRQYAEASGDFNPIHLDDKYARQAGLGGLIAHGMLTMAQMEAMLLDWIGHEGLLTKINVRFEHVVRPGDTITFTGLVRARAENTLVCDLAAENQRTEKVMTGIAHVTLKN
jgi:acyl dehydratase